MRLPETGAQDWETAGQHLGPAAHSIGVIGKLKPGVSLEQARTEMELVWKRVVQETYPARRAALSEPIIALRYE